MREMLEAGVHFGHQTRYWNPKMSPYLFGARNKIHIINLEQTLPLFNDAVNFAGRLASKKGKIMFVGTKRSAQSIIAEEATRAGMPYVNTRWLGGLLTNFKTVKQSINRLKELEAMQTDGSMDRLSKKEALMLTREMDKLTKNFAGIKDMHGIPDALFIIDVGYENIAVNEAKKLGLPVIGVVDSNNSPDGVDYVIPGNDDAIRSIRLYAKSIADAVIDGRGAVAHLGGGNESDEFVELDESGAPIQAVATAPKATTKKKAKKKAAKKVAKKVVEAKAEEAPAEKVEAKTEEKVIDDLTRISGVGPVLVGKLTALGITSFAQVAAFTEEDIERIDGELNFKGRITRDNWVEQAKAFLEEG